MFKRPPFKILIASLLMIALVPFFAPVGNWFWAKGNDGVIALKPPPFVSTAFAEGTTAALFTDEIGIAGYIKVNQTIDLTKVLTLCHNITEQNNDYLICSINVLDYDDNHSPTVYVHKDGWVMAYYPNTEPVSKLIDFRHYTGDAKLPTKFEQVINLVVAKIGAPSATPTYYHFAYPNAKKMILIAEKAEPGRTDDFQVNLPNGFSYFEESWSFARDDIGYYTSEFNLDDQQIAKLEDNSERWEFIHGQFTRNQMSDGNHTITVIAGPYTSSHAAYGGLGLVYSDQ